ncbi:hypothetical protein BCR34DRAFT_600841 [Clohesyomyces aquaticus]|uniref:Uncharacterized protein n=1 Tax=Clohesyomyces aquaticus TaxID=1231657 RepID=A0A1Y1ZQJ4_9PLEO|nr:hypothetical protein BCR34DRAFT_600841 [Clohesyomyces aquaticus]
MVPKVFFAGGAVGFGYYLWVRSYWFPNPYKTQATQNVEGRFVAGGGHPTHTPGGGTPHGPSTEARNINGTGVGTQHHADHVADQRGDDAGVWPKKFYETQLGQPKGK